MMTPLILHLTAQITDQGQVVVTNAVAASGVTTWEDITGGYSGPKYGMPHAFARNDDDQGSHGGLQSDGVLGRAFWSQ